MTPGTTTLYLEGCLNRLRAGELQARDDLLRHSQERLRVMTKRMLARFPGVQRFEQTDDVLNKVLLRMDHLLDGVAVASVRDYLCLAAANIRRELIDLTRHYYGPEGIGANQVDVPPGSTDGATLSYPAADGAISLADWTEFHERVALLPNEEREIFDLLWYHSLTLDEAGELLKVSVSTVKRRWSSARVHLMESLGGQGGASPS